MNYRKTEQYLLPAKIEKHNIASYDIYPSYDIGENKIYIGFKSLANEIKNYKTIIIDGFQGVLFDDFREKLQEQFNHQNISATWYNVKDALKSETEINKMIKPFLGGDDPVFGTRTTLQLQDFFVPEKLKLTTPQNNSTIKIIYGAGAFLCGEEGVLLYIDLPKSEQQFRARAGSIVNIGASSAFDHKRMYKRSYFIDWVVLNRHKKNIISNINIFIDGQNKDVPTWVKGNDLRKALHELSQNVFRVRPWFEPGAWGGNWIMKNIEGLNKNVINYAWSFELIVPENGLLFESGKALFEASFDCLMFLEGTNVLGDCYSRFGDEFPIRFDFLDTFDGGNLSIQCHPRTNYMKTHFGENFTQEECYYILDTRDNAQVYLGFQDDVSPEKFRYALEESVTKKQKIDIEKFVQKHPASKHDLLLIPPGTIHGSGINNMVLEISSTPYIFTFKMYDWLRLDIDGKPRPLNIERGMDNLYFDRKGSVVKEEFISKPQLLHKGNDWEQYHLPTHQLHLYDVYRYHFETTIFIETKNKCHVLSLVEGQKIEITTKNGFCKQFSYAETFVIPAAAESYTVKNLSNTKPMLVLAFVK